ncbi:MAG TPA: FlgD immunoglobulin-like domain containing protein [bacterium]|nr:FlgD immunoglobulin-like domain containing protein [bacterium]HPN42700.1 FlgD immunoglobulin-like domain containing protein [bacterium]
MHKINSLSICIIFIISISYSQQNKTSESFAPVVKDGGSKNLGSQAWEKEDNKRNRYNDKMEKGRKQDLNIIVQNNRPLTSQEETTLQAVIADFQVNENAGPAGAAQENPAIAMDQSGNFIITWQDDRNGYDGDIYAQLFNNNGIQIGANFQVNDDGGCAIQESPAVAIDGLGNFIITWEDRRNNNGDIYAQRFSNSGVAQDINFLVNDEPGGMEQRSPAVAVDSLGNFIITWEDNRNFDYDIYAQRFNSGGVAIEDNFKVNDDIQGENHYNPSVAVDGLGNFIITWEDKRINFYGDIFAQRFTNSGLMQGANFRVNDDSDNTGQRDPAVALNKSGNFIITWEDDRNSVNGDIFAQQYNSNGIVKGANFQINDDSGSSSQALPSVTIDNSGNFIITWVDHRNNNYDIYTQRYTSSGIAQGANFQVNDASDSKDQYEPAVAVDGIGNFIITWVDNIYIDSDIYAQRFLNSGEAQGTNFRINDDTGSSDQWYPSIAVDRVGNFIITWEDYRNDHYGDIYAQLYTFAGVAQGDNFRVNDDSGKMFQRSPDVAVGDSGKFIITWEDCRNNNWDIYAQQYTSNGNVQGANFRINDDAGSEDQWSPMVAMNDSGKIIITWEDERYGNRDIYAQQYTSIGLMQGNNFCVNDDSDSTDQRNPSVAIDKAGNIIITWEDKLDGDNSIFARLYNYNNVIQGSQFKVNDNIEIAYQEYPAVAIDDLGNFIITWQDNRNGDMDIYAQRYNNSGVALGANFQVNDHILNVFQGYPSIATDGLGNFVITWEDGRNRDSDIFAQRYTSNGAAKEANFRVTMTGNKNQSDPVVKLINGRIYNTWQSNHAGGSGNDIWANVLDWDNPVNNIKNNEGDAKLTENYRLKQNYPNPFNPVTGIEYELSHDTEVNISIYNITGELIKIIIAGRQNAGSYKIQWDGRDNSGNSVAGGVYLYQLKADDFVQCKKMILLR